MKKEEFFIGQKFEDVYPPESSMWCNNNNAFIEEITATSSGERRFQIKEIPQPTEEELESAIRQERDFRIGETDWAVSRHAEQVAAGVKTNLTPEQNKELLAYRQNLRDITDVDGFPWGGDVKNAPWPEKPDFL